MIYGRRYRIYPTESQSHALNKMLGCSRYIWNWGVACLLEARNKKEKYPGFFDMCKMLTSFKKQNGLEWLGKDSYTSSLQGALRNLSNALSQHLKDLKDGSKGVATKKRFPSFKKRSSIQSMQFPSGARLGDGFVYIPKIGNVKAVIHTPVGGIAKTFTVTKTASGKYFISICVHSNVPDVEKKPLSKDSKSVGIDLGINVFATISNGTEIENPRFLKSSERLLKIRQRRLSRKKKGGKNYEKEKLKVAVLHEKIKNRRSDFLHKVSRKIVDDNSYDLIGIEDLSVKNMMQGNVAKSLSDVAFREFRGMLEYKSDAVGKTVDTCGRFEKTSQIDHKTGKLIVGFNRSTQIVYHEDGSETSRDMNAAINIDLSVRRKHGI